MHLRRNTNRGWIRRHKDKVVSRLGKLCGGVSVWNDGRSVFRVRGKNVRIQAVSVGR